MNYLQKPKNMKNMKLFNKLMLSILFVNLYAAIASFLGGFHFTDSLIWTTLLMAGLSFVPKQSGVLNATIYREAWTGEVIKYVTAAIKNTFIEGIPDYSKYVSNVGDESQAIHIAEMNVLPEVLINNTTYPISIAHMSVQDILMQLDKFQTVATPITDDEIYASSVKKMELVRDRHGKAIAITIIRKALHALAPTVSVKKMPVIVTSGPDDGAGRKRLQMSDILSFKSLIDELEIDESSRRLVLCNEHVNDLIAEDRKLEGFFFNRTSGEIQPNLLSFNIHTHVSAPYFDPYSRSKRAYGAVPQPTDSKASVFFSLDRAAKAIGWTKMYLSKAEDDPQNQRSLINFRQNAIIMPTAEEHRGAIVSEIV